MNVTQNTGAAMDNRVANAMLAIVLAAALGVVVGGHTASRVHLPQVADCKVRQAESLKYVRLLEREGRELRESIVILKARESLITEATLRDLGLDKHYRVVKNKEATK